MSDLIDREAALNCFHSWVNQYGDVYTPDEMPEYQAIEALPSAQPERMRGRWIPNIYPDVGDGYRCSQCGAYHVVPYKFCHNCGADMRGEQDEMC